MDGPMVSMRVREVKEIRTLHRTMRNDRIAGGIEHQLVQSCGYMRLEVTHASTGNPTPGLYADSSAVYSVAKVTIDANTMLSPV